MIPNILWFKLSVLLGVCLLSATGVGRLCAQDSQMRGAADRPPNAGSLRGAEGSEVPEPEDLRSVAGALKVQLAFRHYVDARGNARYCYVTNDGAVSPTLRVKPGDTLILSLKNEAVAESASDSGRAAAPNLGAMKMKGGPSDGAGGQARDACAGGPMAASATDTLFRERAAGLHSEVYERAQPHPGSNSARRTLLRQER